MKTSSESKIIIRNTIPGLSDLSALNMVRSVIEAGKISRNNTWYCYVTKFELSFEPANPPHDYAVVLYTGPTKKGSHRFLIIKDRDRG